MKKLTAIILCIIMCFVFASCGSEGADIDGNSEANETETIMFTDSCGREVEIPTEITRVAPCGAVAQMVLTTINPDVLVGLANEFSDNQKKYFPKELYDLPVFGQLYGSNPNLNKEAMLAADPQVIIDVGDMKETQKQDMDEIQEQTGLPVIFVETSLDKFGEAYRTLGKLLGSEEKGEELAAYTEDTINTAKANAAKVEKQKTVYYGGGPDGLACNAEGSVQADVIDVIGAKNAIVVDEINHAGGGNLIGLEEMYNTNPDIILINDDGAYDDVISDDSWAKLDAVREGAVYEIPGEPYCWMSAPPSMNRLLGIWWLGNLVYPQLYDYDMTEKTKEYYKLFYGYELSDDEAKAMLANSSLKIK